MNMHERTRKTSSRQFMPGAAPVRFEALDSWRGIAAILIVLFHAQIVSNIHRLEIVRLAEIAVDFFFVLSGFVIAHAYLPRLTDGGSVTKFLFLRLGRLYPLHLFMLGLFLLFEIAKASLPFPINPADPAFSGTNEPQFLISNLLLVHVIWPFDTLSWNTPSWSISAEFIAYVLFALAVLLARRRLPYLLAAVLVLAPLALHFFSEEGMNATYGMGAMRAVYGFAAGALVYIMLGKWIHAARKAGSSRDRLRWSIIETAAVMLAFWLILHAKGGPLAYVTPLAFAMMVAVFAIERGGVSDLLKKPLPVFIGTLSYSIYMTHIFIQLRMTNIARLSDSAFDTGILSQVGPTERYGIGIDPGNLFVGDLLMVAMLGLTIAVSYLTWRFVERPGQALFRHWSDFIFVRRDSRVPA